MLLAWRLTPFAVLACSIVTTEEGSASAMFYTGKFTQPVTEPNSIVVRCATTLAILALPRLA